MFFGCRDRTLRKSTQRGNGAPYSSWDICGETGENAEEGLKEPSQPRKKITLSKGGGQGGKKDQRLRIKGLGCNKDVSPNIRNQRGEVELVFPEEGYLGGIQWGTCVKGIEN